MTLDQIKAAVRAGHTVCWHNCRYKVTCDNIGQWFITYREATCIGNCIGLTARDGVTMNGQPEEFFIAGEQGAQ